MPYEEGEDLLRRLRGQPGEGSAAEGPGEGSALLDRLRQQHGVQGAPQGAAGPVTPEAAATEYSEFFRSPEARQAAQWMSQLGQAAPPAPTRPTGPPETGGVSREPRHVAGPLYVGAPEPLLELPAPVEPIAGEQYQRGRQSLADWWHAQGRAMRPEQVRELGPQYEQFAKEQIGEGGPQISPPTPMYAQTGAQALRTVGEEAATGFLQATVPYAPNVPEFAQFRRDIPPAGPIEAAARLAGFIPGFLGPGQVAMGVGGAARRLVLGQRAIKAAEGALRVGYGEAAVATMGRRYFDALRRLARQTYDNALRDGATSQAASQTATAAWYRGFEKIMKRELASAGPGQSGALRSAWEYARSMEQLILKEVAGPLRYHLADDVVQPLVTGLTYGAYETGAGVMMEEVKPEEVPSHLAGSAIGFMVGHIGFRGITSALKKMGVFPENILEKLKSGRPLDANEQAIVDRLTMNYWQNVRDIPGIGGPGKAPPPGARPGGPVPPEAAGPGVVLSPRAAPVRPYGPAEYRYPPQPVQAPSPPERGVLPRPLALTKPEIPGIPPGEVVGPPAVIPPPTPPPEGPAGEAARAYPGVVRGQEAIGRAIGAVTRGEAPPPPVPPTEPPAGPPVPRGTAPPAAPPEPEAPVPSDTEYQDAKKELQGLLGKMRGGAQPGVPDVPAEAPGGAVAPGAPPPTPTEAPAPPEPPPAEAPEPTTLAGSITKVRPRKVPEGAGRHEVMFGKLQKGDYLSTAPDPKTGKPGEIWRVAKTGKGGTIEKIDPETWNKTGDIKVFSLKNIRGFRNAYAGRNVDAEMKRAKKAAAPDRRRDPKVTQKRWQRVIERLGFWWGQVLEQGPIRVDESLRKILHKDVAASVARKYPGGMVLAKEGQALDETADRLARQGFAGGDAVDARNKIIEMITDLSTKEPRGPKGRGQFGDFDPSLEPLSKNVPAANLKQGEEVLTADGNYWVVKAVEPGVIKLSSFDGERVIALDEFDTVPVVSRNLGKLSEPTATYEAQDFYFGGMQERPSGPPQEIWHVAKALPVPPRFAQKYPLGLKVGATIGRAQLESMGFKVPPAVGQMPRGPLVKTDPATGKLYVSGWIDRPELAVKSSEQIRYEFNPKNPWRLSEPDDDFANAAPEMRELLLKVGSYHMARGATGLDQLTERLVGEFGQDIRPFVPGLHGLLSRIPAFRSKLQQGAKHGPVRTGGVPPGPGPAAAGGRPGPPEREGPRPVPDDVAKPEPIEPATPDGEAGADVQPSADTELPETRTPREGGVVTISAELMPELSPGSIELLRKSQEPTRLEQLTKKFGNKRPMPHQLENFVRIIQAFEEGGHGYIITDGTGTGKTLTSGLALNHYLEQNPRTRILTIVRNETIMRKVWQSDIMKWAKWTPYWSKGTFQMTPNTMNFMSYAKMEEMFRNDTLGRIEAFAPDILIFDESHALKYFYTKQTRTAMAGEKITRWAKKTLFLSATPFESLLQTGYLTALKLWPNKTHRQWIEDELDVHYDQAKGVWTGLSSKKVRKFHEVMIRSGRMSRNEIDFGNIKNSKGEYVTLTSENVMVPMSEKVQTEYDRIDGVFRALLENFSSPSGWVNPKISMLVKGLRHLVLRSLDEYQKLPAAIAHAKQARAEGKSVIFMTLRKGRTSIEKWWQEHVEAEREYIEGIRKAPKYKKGSKMPEILTFLRRHDIEIPSPIQRLRREFPDAVEITGDQQAGGAERQHAIDQFQENEAKEALVTLAAGAESLSLHDLKGGNPRITYVMSLPYTAQQVIQVAGRNFRLGSETNSEIIWLFNDTPTERKVASVTAGTIRLHRGILQGDVEAASATDLEQFEFPELSVKKPELGGMSKYLYDDFSDGYFNVEEIRSFYEANGKRIFRGMRPGTKVKFRSELAWRPKSITLRLFRQTYGPRIDGIVPLTIDNLKVAVFGNSTSKVDDWLRQVMENEFLVALKSRHGREDFPRSISRKEAIQILKHLDHDERSIVYTQHEMFRTQKGFTEGTIVKSYPPESVPNHYRRENRFGDRSFRQFLVKLPDGNEVVASEQLMYPADENQLPYRLDAYLKRLANDDERAFAEAYSKSLTTLAFHPLETEGILDKIERIENTRLRAIKRDVISMLDGDDPKFLFPEPGKRVEEVRAFYRPDRPRIYTGMQKGRQVYVNINDPALSRVPEWGEEVYKKHRELGVFKRLVGVIKGPTEPPEVEGTEHNVVWRTSRWFEVDIKDTLSQKTGEKDIPVRTMRVPEDALVPVEGEVYPRLFYVLLRNLNKNEQWYAENYAKFVGDPYQRMPHVPAGVQSNRAELIRADVKSVFAGEEPSNILREDYVPRPPDDQGRLFEDQPEIPGGKYQPSTKDQLAAKKRDIERKRQAAKGEPLTWDDKTLFGKAEKEAADAAQRKMFGEESTYDGAARRSPEVIKADDSKYWAKLIETGTAITVPNMTIDSPGDAALLFDFMKNRAQENAYVAYVKGNRVVGVQHLGLGKVNTIDLEVRAILSGIQSLGADGVYLAHNHPSGSPIPSFSDAQITKEFHRMAVENGFKFHGHIVVDGPDKYGLIRSGLPAAGWEAAMSNMVNSIPEDSRGWAEKYFRWAVTGEGSEPARPKEVEPLVRQKVISFITNQISEVKDLPTDATALRSGTVPELALAARVEGVGEAVVTPDQATTAYLARMKDPKVKHTMFLFLDTKNKVRGHVILDGGIDYIANNAFEKLAVKNAIAGFVPTSMIVVSNEGQLSVPDQQALITILRHDIIGLQTAEIVQILDVMFADTNYRNRTTYRFKSMKQEGVMETAPRGDWTLREPRWKQNRIENKQARIRARHEIVKDLTRAVMTVQRTGRLGPVSRFTRAYFKTQENVIRDRLFSNIRNTSHEAGHRLVQLLFGKGYARLGRAKESDLSLYKKELLPLAPPMQRGDIEEGFAEFLRGYIMDPEAIQRKAPSFHAYFERTMADELPDVHLMIKGVQSDYALYRQADWRAKGLSTIESASTPGGRIPIGTPFRRIYQMLWDDFTYIRSTTEKMMKMRGIQNLPAAMDPRILVSTHAGRWGLAQAMIERGQFTFNKPGQITAPGLLQLADELGTNLMDYELYAKARTGLEKEKVYGKPIEEIVGLEKEVATKAVQELGPKFGGNFLRVRRYGWNLLDYLVQGGMMDAKYAAKLKKTFPDYSALWRAIDTETRGRSQGFLGGTLTGLFSPIRHFKGSDRPTIPAFEALAKLTFLVMDRVERNAVMEAYVKMAAATPGAGRDFVEEVPEPKWPVRLSMPAILNQLRKIGIDPKQLDIAEEDLEKWVTIFMPSWNRPPAPYDWVWINGRRRFFWFNPDIYREMQNLDREFSNTIVRIFNIPVRTLKAGAVVLNLPFAAMSAARDVPVAAIQSQNTAKMAALLLPSIFDALGKTDNYYKYLRAGTGMATFIQPTPRGLSRLIQGRIRRRARPAKYWLNPVNQVREMLALLADIGLAGENMPRIAEAKVRGLREAVGRSQLLGAGYGGRESTIDFNRGGTLSRLITQMAAFFMPGMGGPDRMIREIATHPTRSLLRFWWLLVLPTLAYYAYVRNDKRWRNIPQHVRDREFVFWIGDDPEPYTYPKTYQWGDMATLIERALEWQDNDDPLVFDKFIENYLRGLPNPIPTAVSPMVENAMNMSTYTGAPIAPSRGEPSEQYWKWTTETAKDVGRALGYSPAKIENLVRGYTGGIGTKGLEVVDRIRGLHQERVSSAADQFIVGRFRDRYPRVSGEYVSRFYDLWVPAREVYESFTGKIRKDPEDLRRYAGQRAELLGLYNTLKPAAQVISMHRNIYDMVSAAPMDEKLRKERLDSIAIAMNQAAERVLNSLDLTSVTLPRQPESPERRTPGYR